MRPGRPPALCPAPTHAVTAPSTTSASTSSTTAAPRMILASSLREARMSFRTRAVIPTLVAVIAAPIKTWAAIDASGMNTADVTVPIARVDAVPITATANDEGPTPRRSRTDRSTPTSNRSRSIPTRDKMSRYGSAPRNWSFPRPIMFPRIMPATSSPRTAGWPIRVATCPPSRAAATMIARPRASQPNSSNGPWAPRDSANPPASRRTATPTTTT